jgi:hypothetical protein
MGTDALKKLIVPVKTVGTTTAAYVTPSVVRGLALDVNLIEVDAPVDGGLGSVDRSASMFVVTSSDTTDTFVA